MAVHSYRIRLQLKSPLSTPLHSGTLFGQLCWAWREAEGESALEQWLAALPDEPFLISAAFPEGWLPRPLLKPSRQAMGPIKDRAGLDAAEHEKTLRKQSLIRFDDFLRLRDHVSEETLTAVLLQRSPSVKKQDRPPSLTTHRAAHNTINRLTGTTPDSGGLYFMNEQWPGSEGSARFELYVRCGVGAGQLQGLFTHVGSHGFGKDASIGRGQFDARVEPAPEGLFDEVGNRLLSLSHGSLTPNMQQPRYRVDVHYGKTGSVYAISGKPFKHPLTLLKPGATFLRTGDGPFGELLRNVHKDYGQIVHNAWHLTVPYTEVE